MVWITLQNEHNDYITLNSESIDYIAEYKYLMDKFTITIGLRGSHIFHFKNNESNRKVLESALGYK